MRVEKKESVKNSIGRLIFVLLCVLIQITWIVLLLMRLSRYSTVINILSSLLALGVTVRIYVKNTNAAFKMPWIILILVFPVLGLSLYLLFGHAMATGWTRRRFERIHDEMASKLVQDQAVIKELEEKEFAVANQCRYIWEYGHYPVYKNTNVMFHSIGEEGLEAQLEEMERAEKFIFMEYHAIEESLAFGRIREVLSRKAKSGVEVRILYDDVGSIGFINIDFMKRMEQEGIQCRVFNPVVPFLNVFMNNRDHRKITVIDGKVGFTGGYNLADEYFNITHPYGHWKDTGLKLTGAGVRSLTLMFLEMWNAMKETDKKYHQYLPSIPGEYREGGYVQPYGDSPLDDEYLGENVYLNLIKYARHRLYVATPYLIISDEMNRELGMAAKRGVDVRIITPGIPDKKLIYKMTRSYYPGLVRQGVRIFEYTPGFLHEKQMLCDCDTAVVGTINLDYRSLYHHFENGVFLHGCSAVEDIEADFLKIMDAGMEVTEKYAAGRFTVIRGVQSILRLFAPLL